MDEDKYLLTPAERAMITQFQARRLNAKARLADLHDELRAAQHGFEGALAMLLQQRGWTSGELSEDLTVLSKKG